MATTYSGLIGRRAPETFDYCDGLAALLFLYRHVLERSLSIFS